MKTEPVQAGLLIVLILHALSVIVQAVCAGQFLSGIEGAVVLHVYIAWIILGICLIQAVLAALLLRSGGSLWLLVGSLGLFLAEGFQIGCGYGRLLAVHIPLGTLILGAVIGQLVWIFRQRPLSKVPA
jgi:hypothetical protein